MEIVVYILIFIMGSFIGSFLTLAVYRIPRKENIIYKHSYCPKCNHKLSVLDLFPIFSYVFLKGRCRYCKEKIRPRYLILEIISGIVFLLLAISFNFDFNNIYVHKIFLFIFTSLYFITLILIAGIDKENINIQKSVLIFALFMQAIYMIYLYVVGKANIYRYIMYLILIVILLIINKRIKKKTNKEKYVINILVLCSYISSFTNREIFILTVAIGLVFIAISAIKNKKIPIGFYLCMSNIAIVLINNFLVWKG